LVLAIIADDLGTRRRQWYITTSLIAVVLAGIGPITDVDRRPVLNVYRRDSILIIAGAAIAFHPS